MSDLVELVIPDWPHPKNVKSLVTTRLGGFSKSGYSSFNLATHVGDDPESVKQNRALLGQYLPSQPIWLNQVHGIEVCDASTLITSDAIPTADAIVTNIKNQVLSIMTADCLPIIFSSKDGEVVGAAHAGWRGLCHGVIENTVKEMNRLLSKMNLLNKNEDIHVWLGAAIGENHFEVGQEVLDAFLEADEGKNNIAACFKRTEISGKYLGDLHALAKIRLLNLGISKIYGHPHCCYEDERHYFSYRRNQVTGRFATLIWITPS